MNKPEIMNVLRSNEFGYTLHTHESMSGHEVELTIETSLPREEFVNSEGYAEALAMAENEMYEDLRLLKEFFLNLAV